MKKLIIVLLVVFFLPTIGQAAEKKVLSQAEEYDLRERCGQRAKEFFKAQSGDKTPGQGYEVEGGLTFSQYRNHYNKKLNKCFILIEEITIKKPNTLTGAIKHLYDVNEFYNYANFAGTYSETEKPSLCSASGYTCGSQKEWDILVKPYMEE